MTQFSTTHKLSTSNDLITHRRVASIVLFHFSFPFASVESVDQPRCTLLHPSQLISPFCRHLHPWNLLSYLSSNLLDVELLATLIGPIVKQSDPNMSQEQQDPDMIEEEDEEALISGPLLVAKLQVSTHTSLVKRQHPD